MSRRERWVVFLMGCCHTMVHFYEQVFPALIPLLVVYFSIKLDTAGDMQMMLALMFGLGALPAGFLADRIGSKRLVLIYLVGAAVSCLFISAANSIGALTVGLTALGAFISLYHPAGTTLVTMEVKQVGKALGYHGVGGGLGVAAAPALAAALAVISPKYGWRLSFAVFGVIGLLVAAGVATLRFRAVPTENSREKFWPEHLAKGSARPLILFLFVAVTVGFSYRGIMTFLPTYFAQNLSGGIFMGQDIVKGGTFATLTLLVGVVGQFIGGQLTGRFNSEKLYGTLLLITVPMLVLMSVFSNYALFFVTMAFAFFHFSGQPVGNSLIAEYTDPRGRGLGYGLYFSMAFGVGSFSAGFCGRVATHFGLNNVFVVLAVMTFLGVIMMFYLSKARGSLAAAEIDS